MNQPTEAMKPTSPNPVFSNSPIDWNEPLEFGFSQLPAVAAAAERAGFYILRLKVLPGGYQAQCARLPRPDSVAFPPS